ncbi:hypothetical protein [Lactovum odontotermitis]
MSNQSSVQVDDSLVKLRMKVYEISEDEARAFIIFYNGISDEEKIKMCKSIFGEDIDSITKENPNDMLTWGGGMHRGVRSICYGMWQYYKKENNLSFDKLSDNGERWAKNAEESYIKYFKSA